MSFFIVFVFTVSTVQSISVFAQTRGKLLQKQTVQNEIELLRQKGFDRLKTGEWNQANEIFESLIIKLPDDYLALYGNGLALFNLRRIAEADKNISKAVGLLSEKRINENLLADSLVLSALILAAQNKNDEAIEKLNRAVKIAPVNFDANFSLARAYFGNREFADAAKYFKISTTLHPDHLQAKFFLATALERSGNLQEALSEYRAVVKQNENYADGNAGLGVLLINLEGEKSVEGLNALQKAVTLNGNLYEARVTLGKTLLRLNRLNEALENLKKAAELAPENPEPHFQLSIAYRKLGKKAETAAETEIVKKIHAARRGVTENKK
ncbi:MAG: tetratricopeptide repeat protein [Pyrinomonadaceae bacterium]